MALENLGSTPGNGVAFLVGALAVYEVIAANCSSPQTAELNANARAATLMKWVHIGLVQSAVLVTAAAFYDRRHAKPIILGGALGAAVMYGCYYHAQQAGLASAAPPTEDWSTPAPTAQAA